MLYIGYKNFFLFYLMNTNYYVLVNTWISASSQKNVFMKFIDLKNFFFPRILLLISIFYGRKFAFYYFL